MRPIQVLNTSSHVETSVATCHLGPKKRPPSWWRGPDVFDPSLHKALTIFTRLNESPLRVVPRAAEQVFRSARELAPLGWAFEFEASFLEIYNDELRDLLPASEASASSAAPSAPTPPPMNPAATLASATVPPTMAHTDVRNSASVERACVTCTRMGQIS